MKDHHFERTKWKISHHSCDYVHPGDSTNPMKASAAMGLATVSTAAAVASTIPSLAAFVHPAPSVAPSKPSTKLWKVVSPSPRKRTQCDLTTKSAKVKKKQKAKGPPTVSFDAITAENFPGLKNSIPAIHTLILGTHPSIRSLAESQYFGHPMK